MGNPITCQLSVRHFAAPDTLIASAVDACKQARGITSTLQQTAEAHLHAVREAGRLLSIVQRSDGGRPHKNSSRGLTSYQHAVQQAGISRQTANRWRRVAAIPEDAFDQFIDDAIREGWDLTIAELLRVCDPPSAPEERPNTVTLHLSDAELRTFEQHIGVLTGSLFCRDNSEAVMAIVQSAYTKWLGAQHEGDESRHARVRSTKVSNTVNSLGRSLPGGSLPKTCRL
jgi:hypothetical protein